MLVACFIIGMLVGGSIGYVIAALLSANSREEKE